jgi:hypothetical protein
MDTAHSRNGSADLSASRRLAQTLRNKSQGVALGIIDTLFYSTLLDLPLRRNGYTPLTLLPTPLTAAPRTAAFLTFS